MAEQKPPDEFMLMRSVYDNLRMMNYETEFGPIQRHFSYLNALYFAVPARSSKEQFDYFAALCIWIMQTYLGQSVAMPSEYEDPAAVADNLMLALHGCGLKLSFSAQKIVAGWGLAVCTILDALIRQGMKRKRPQLVPYRPIKAPGSAAEMPTRDEEDEVVEDVFGDEDSDGETVQPALVTEATADRANNIADLRGEAERVGPQLQIRIPAAKSDWRSHFTAIGHHHQEICQCVTQLTPIIAKVSADVLKAVQAVENREKSLNTRFAKTVGEYAEGARKLAGVEARHKQQVSQVRNLQAELDDVVQKLNATLERLSEKQRVASDNSPLRKIKEALARIKDQCKSLELRSAVLQRSLTQAWRDSAQRGIE